ncbi:hypothetical protein FOMPIDRAFT_1026623 [Fomitopsis schrenkii]|uniref:Pali-domain-containing protein n=1 Tax=Fomitopsis schrenkii TaxID=2126942 RepID=S8ETU4_FOMSC|nr:hypothetical protein FOMPIDRAFT_1026623 [Fomitopsis schrenkii]
MVIIEKGFERLINSRSVQSFKELRSHPPRPLKKYIWISLANCFLFFSAFLLYLLVALSTPVIKDIFLFRIEFTQEGGNAPSPTATDLRFGVWGLCAYSSLPGFVECYGPRLGYDIPQSILDIVGYQDIIDGVDEALTAILVLHPITAGLAFATIFTALFLESHAMCIISLVLSIITIIVGALVFAIDIGLGVIGHIKIAALDNYQYSVSWGPAVWMVLAGLVCLLVGMILLSVIVCECCGVHEFDEDEGEKEETLNEA